MWLKALIVFVSSDVLLGVVDLGVPEGYNELWGKTKAAFAHLHQRYPGYDWYLKADDDT